MKDYEQLGRFFLGHRHDLDLGKTGTDPILYDAGDLTTHAVCVGMTGSGKTGLCQKLEARGIAFDRPYTEVPALGLSIAFFTDPFGTYIELTEGLDAL